MWKRFVQVLRCPVCRGPLELRTLLEEHVAVSTGHLECARRRGVYTDDFNVYVDAALLLCAACYLKFPIFEGLPILLPYTTPLHSRFDEQWKSSADVAGGRFRYANREPVSGEEFVAKSFSSEWLAYDYDGVIWDLSYDAHRERIIKEIGPTLAQAQWHLEIGCGLGLATNVAQESFGCDAVGLDLSLAALKAARQFRFNPFLHFVQASAFSIPLRRDFFDVIYSRGVLHHTYSTEKAFRCVAEHCRNGGTFYVWLYGPNSIRSNPLRMTLYGLEVLTRPILSRAPDSNFAKAFLGAMALGYVGFNRLRRLKSAEVQPLTFSRGVHSARDRFTPRFAHRQGAREILGWFSDCGYEKATVLDWRGMPVAEREDFRRNVGVRAIRASCTRP
jgi:SAM-dependent methyltransferase/uncharacterized protein YbaR (Trm112 family)